MYYLLKESNGRQVAAVKFNNDKGEFRKEVARAIREELCADLVTIKEIPPDVFKYKEVDLIALIESDGDLSKEDYNLVNITMYGINI